MPTTYLVALAIIGWGIGSLFYKVANDSIHPIMVSTIVTGVYIVMTPLTFMLMKFDRSVNTSGVLFSVLGGVCMAVGSMGYFFALRKGGAGEVTTVTALYPALTMALSMIFLQEGLSLKKGIGMALAILSFIILSIK